MAFLVSKIPRNYSRGDTIDGTIPTNAFQSSFFFSCPDVNLSRWVVGGDVEKFCLVPVKLLRLFS